MTNKQVYNRHYLKPYLYRYSLISYYGYSRLVYKYNKRHRERVLRIVINKNLYESTKYMKYKIKSKLTRDPILKLIITV
jgi:hypothetical protein